MAGVNGPLFAAPGDVANSNKVIAYLTDAAGNGLTSSTVGGSQALDVNLVQSVALTVNQGTSPWVIGDGGGSITVDAVDLDIRNLSAAQDNVQAWNFDGTGTAITSTLVSGKQGLDVNIISAITVDVNGVYNVGTNPTPDNVGVIAHTRSATPGASDQVERTTAGLPGTGVVAANVHGLDVNSFLMGFNGSTFDHISSTSQALDVNIKSSTNSVSVNESYSSWKAAAGTVTTTAAALPTSALANRRLVSVYNNGSKPIFVGELVGVTSSSGFPIYPGIEQDFKLEAGAVLYAVAQSGSQDVRVAEFAKA